MSDDHGTQELDLSAICVAVHSDLDKPCPICGAAIDACCIEDGEELPVYAAHIGRATGGEPVTIMHTGEYDAEGNGVFRAIEN